MGRRAVIVGGGIGGLAAAAYLQSHDWQVEVHERTGQLPASGTTLAIWPTALRALDVIGLGEHARDLGPAPSASTFQRPNGRRIASLNLAAVRRRAGEDLRLVSRPALLGLLASRLEPGTVRFGSTVTDHASLGEADVVIGADGLNSATRTAVFGPRYRGRYTGSTVWRGSAAGDTDAMSETWGEGGLFGITPCEGGHTNWYASAPALEGDRATEGELAALHARFGRWHSGIRQVLGAIDATTVVRHGLYRLDPPLPSYVAGHVALVGDAAHAMSPVLGRGACEALLDALDLVRRLVTQASVEQALRAYDTQRRPPTQRLARAAAFADGLVHSRRFTPLRDLTLRLSLATAPLG